MTKEEFLLLVPERYDEPKALIKTDNFYDYGNGFEDTRRPGKNMNVEESAGWRNR